MVLERKLLVFDRSAFAARSLYNVLIINEICLHTHTPLVNSEMRKRRANFICYNGKKGRVSERGNAYHAATKATGGGTLDSPITPV